MKPVANISKVFFPKEGDVIELLGSIGSPGLRYTIVGIASCSRQTGDCRQDDHCQHCLRLILKTDGEIESSGHVTNHCWKDCRGRPYWKIIEEA